MKDFLSAVHTRRSIYKISKGSPISDEDLCSLMEKAVLYTPSPYNMQSARVAVLLGEHNDRFWSITADTLCRIVPAEGFAAAEQKLRSFAAGYGTVLFFDDTSVTNDFAGRFQAGRENFPVWAQQANGMLQSNIWILLEEVGFGASLQHYNPLIDDEVKDAWDLPESWTLIAQMPFGLPAGVPEEKTSLPLEDRLFVFR